MPQSDPSTSAPRPKRRTTPTPAREIARLAVEGLQSKKGVDVTVIDVRKVSGVTDYYVIATGESDLQVRAMHEAVQEIVKERTGERVWKREGTDTLQWVVLDYVDVVVHIFDPERRTFYDLERLWGDAPTEHVASDAEEVALLRDGRPTQGGGSEEGG
jgi:ribosome-associated protein